MSKSQQAATNGHSGTHEKSWQRLLFQRRQILPQAKKGEGLIKPPRSLLDAPKERS